MGIAELLLIAAGLAMDAFAVSLCRGLSMKRFRANDAFIIALFFGGFQAAMPLIGWALGKQFEQYITGIDHWIAFILLAIIGLKMLYDAYKGEDDTAQDDGSTLNIKQLLIMAIATSIDALAVGVTFAFLKVDIVFSVTAIGVLTFGISFAGVFIGNRFGSMLQSKAEIFGGFILILIGAKILFDHLGVFA